MATVFNTFLFYLELRDLKSFTLKAIGSVCIRHYDMMLGPELKQMYHDILSDPECSFELKIQVSSSVILVEVEFLVIFCYTVKLLPNAFDRNSV